MKRLLLLFVLCFSTVCLMAQDYRPIFEEGKVWNYEMQKFSPELMPDIQTYFVDGDTLITDKICFKLYSTLNDKITYLVGYFYEKDGKVFMIREKETTEFLIYDFTVNKGDLISIFNCETNKMSDVKIEDVLVLNIQGRDAKCVIHESDGFYTQGWWLEGVGSLHGFEHNISKTDPGHNIVMKSCYLGDKCLFLSDEDVVANIGKITNSTPRSVKDNVIYDLSGRRLSEKPREGMYVQGGRVYIAK